MNTIQNWRSFELDAKLERLDSDIFDLGRRIDSYYSDLSNIDRKNNLVEVVKTLDDMADAIYIFKSLYRKEQ